MKRALVLFLTIAAGLATVFGPSPTAAPAEEAGPDIEAAAEFIRKLADDTLKIAEKSDITPARRDEEFDALLDKGVDTQYMSRFVLGRNWHKASAEQRAEFSRLFRRFLLKNLTERLSDYKSQTFVVKGGITSGNRDVLVKSEVQRQNGPALPVEWRVRRFDGEWQIIDLKAEGVSLLITHREEFSSVVQRRGIDGLLASLRDKVETLENDKSKASHQAQTSPAEPAATPQDEAH